MPKFKLTIVTPEKKLFEGEAESVSVPGEKGEMTILAGHAPLLATLKAGKVKVVVDSNGETLEINEGFIDVTNSGVTVLVKKSPSKKET